MANDHRGEVDAEVGGQTYRLKLTLDAIRRLEQETGKGWQTFVKLALKADLFFDDIIALFRCGVVGGGGRAPKREDVAALIEEHGIIAFTAPIQQLVLLQSIGSQAASGMQGREEGNKGPASTGPD